MIFFDEVNMKSTMRIIRYLKVSHGRISVHGRESKVYGHKRIVYGL